MSITCSISIAQTENKFLEVGLQETSNVCLIYGTSSQSRSKTHARNKTNISVGVTHYSMNFSISENNQDDLNC